MGSKMDSSTREYVDARIKEHIAEGDKPKVAVARSYEEARQVGFDVPEQRKGFSFFSIFRKKQDGGKLKRVS
jgi:hypothetical protein